ncbi:radical SAM protein [Clostridioides difficile]
MSYRFSNYSNLIINRDKVILGNLQSGYWTKISKEVYDILTLGIDKNYSIEQLKLSLYDDEDRAYISTLYDNLCFIGIIEDENHRSIVKNKIASFEITHRCNLKCTHCCVDADQIASKKEDLSTEGIKQILDKLIKWNPERIMLSGGEPMLRSDFIELLIYLKENYTGDIVISTNATLINKDNVEIISKYAHQIDISIDGVDEESCSIIRGPGVFDKVMKSVKLLKDTGFEKISLSMVVSDKNEHLQEQFNLLNERLGTKAIFRGFAAIGRGKKNKSHFSEYGENEVYISEDYLSDDFDESIGICSCKGGRQELFIAYNGDVYPCPSFIKKEFLIGNILDVDKVGNLEKFKEDGICNYNLTNIINFENNKECIDCKVNLFCWTCPGKLDELNGNKLALKDKCSKIKPILYKRVWGE